MPPECTTSAAGRPEGSHASTGEQLLFQLKQDELKATVGRRFTLMP